MIKIKKRMMTIKKSNMIKMIRIIKKKTIKLIKKAFMIKTMTRNQKRPQNTKMIFLKNMIQTKKKKNECLQELQLLQQLRKMKIDRAPRILM